MTSHDRRASVPAHERYVAFERVRARVASGSWRHWTVEATGASLPVAREKLAVIIREEGFAKH